MFELLLFVVVLWLVCGFIAYRNYEKIIEDPNAQHIVPPAGWRSVVGFTFFACGPVGILGLLVYKASELSEE